MHKAFSKGFTLIEILVVIAVIGILVVISSVSFVSFRNDSDVSGAAEEMTAVLRTTKSKSLSGADGEKHGVSFDADAKTYTVLRLSNADPPIETNVETYSLPDGIEAVSDPSKFFRVYISSTGQIGASAEVSGNDAGRTKDSRHVHIAYSRPIDTLTESIVLDFGSATQTIVIAGNLSGGVMKWEGDVDVGGEFQHVKIHTHRLNNPDTLFSVHRDKRYNTEGFEIEIDSSPDPDTGTLISYDVNGQTTQGTSVHVSAPEWQ
ncbi:MAG: prepilin-type N-terminal cleavage/methylation domain-containing protein [Candidatus Wildermuthbacteria bacterium]|nr:prepilin-type N-terminal cleavage/methylation domain-containing protein [Candidatus Wildermuthbacteria bacterium]